MSELVLALDLVRFFPARMLEIAGVSSKGFAISRFLICFCLLEFAILLSFFLLLELDQLGDCGQGSFSGNS